MTDRHEEHDEPVYHVASEEQSVSDTGEQTVSHYHDDGQPAGSLDNGLLERFPVLKNKRVVGGILGAVVVLMLFHFMQPHPVLEQMNKSTVPKSTPTAAPPPMASAQLERLADDEKSHQQSLKQLQQKVSMLHDAAQTSAAKIDTVQAAVVELAAQVAELNKELQAQHQASLRLPQPVPQYYVRAIVPGRAWVSTPRGESQTLVVGSRLVGYGHVKQIDPNKGQVIMTTGKVLMFLEHTPS